MTDTLGARLALHAARHPDARAVTFLEDGDTRERVISFGELHRRSSALAARIRAACPDGQRALVVGDAGLDFVIALCGCLIAGVAAIPSPPPAARLQSRAARRFANLVIDAAPDLILVHSSMQRKLTWFAYDQAGLWSERFLTIDNPADTTVDVALPPPAADTMAIIQYTSGSTSSPQGVVISHGNLAANLESIRVQFELDRTSRVVSWLPLFHDMGLIGGVFESLWTGYELILMDTRHFARQPLRWLAAIERYGADVSGGANFGYDLCANAAQRLSQVPRFDLSHWRLAFSGAEPVRATTVQKFAETFGESGLRRTAFYPTYGLAEATLMVTGPAPGQDRPRLLTRDGGSIVSCGSVVQHTSVRIVDPQTGAVCTPGSEGEIWVAGDGISAGYWQGRDKQLEDIRRRLPGDTRDYLPTGDVGFFDDNELFICGRLRDLIIIRGQNYFPHDIEEVARTSHPALDRQGCAAFSIDDGVEERLVLACELDRASRRQANRSEIIRAVAGQVSAQIDVAPYDIVLLRPGALPKTTSGKLQRRACAELYANGAWASFEHLRGLVPSDPARVRFSATTQAERREQIEDYLCDRIGALDRSLQKLLSPETSLQVLGIDSLTRIELGLWIEEEVGVTLDVELLSEDLTIAELAAEIRALTTREAAPGASLSPAPMPTPGSVVPMTPLQRDFIEAEVARPETFLEIVFMRTPRHLNLAALEQALAALSAVHDAFALRFRRIDGDWCQVVGDADRPIELTRIDAASLGREAFGRLRESLLTDIRAGIDLENGPLVRAVLVDRGAAGGSLLVIGFHHLIIDAVSISILVTQLNQAYINALAGREPLSVTPRRRFGQWVSALEQYRLSPRLSEQLSYWRAITGIPQRLQADGAAPEWLGLKSQRPSLAVNQQLMRRYDSATDRNCLFVAALGWAWPQVTGESRLVQLLENHGRTGIGESDPATAVGWFVCHHPFIFDTNTSPAECLLAAKQAFLAIPDQGIGFGLLPRAERAAASPSAFVQYRGAIDNAFRPDARFPVIGVTHESAPWEAAKTKQGDGTVIWLGVTIRQESFEWRLLHRSPVDATMASRLSSLIGDFLEQLVAGEDRQ